MSARIPGAFPPDRSNPLRGDCSIRVHAPAFTPEEVAACAQRKGLLSLELELEASGRCTCTACQTPAPGTAAGIAAVRPQPALSPDEIRALLDQAAALGCTRCIFADSDETSHPHLPDLIAAARARQMSVELFTTGAGLTPALAAFLHAHRVAVALRLDALDPATQNRLAQNPRAHDTIHHALAHLRAAGYARPAAPTLAIRTSVSPENIADLPALWRWARAAGIEPYVQIITPRDGHAAVIAPDPAKHLFEQLARIDHEEFARPWPLPPALTGRSCNRHLWACHVAACGSVYACVGVTIPLGSIRAEPLRKILDESEVLENLRAYPQKLKESCKTCSQSTDCYGCRGAAYQLTGDYLAADAMCWKTQGLTIESLPVPAAGFVPHGPSMRAIDRLVQIGERMARTETTVAPDSPLVDAAGHLDETAYIEMIAQSFAACHGFQLSPDERLTARGLLLGVKDLVISGEARAGDRLTIEVRKITRFGDFGVIEGDVRHQDGRLIATAQVKIWRPSDEALKAMFP